MTITGLANQHGPNETGGTTRRGRVQSNHCAGTGPHGRPGRGLCGDVEGEELRERASDGLEREASHAGIPESAYIEFLPESERERHGNVLGGE